MTPDPRERPEVGQVCWVDEEVAELSLLLPAWQAAELERLASTRHLTSGQLLRLLITDFLTPQRALTHRANSQSPPVFLAGGESGPVAETHWLRRLANKHCSLKEKDHDSSNPDPV